ncbi:AMIN domain-containing protein [Halodesulfovibrio aestuarii]|uniref:AMIN domain-containing protein n=1 Tax=Halodesulfovibrio aestuarii TaxID=126333 RepID=A0ABV4JUW1_9BACT
MNRNISMLIVLALVVGTVLIGYNKWIRREAYTISENASSQVSVNTSTQESQALQDVVIGKSTSDTLSSTAPKADHAKNSDMKAGSSSLQVPVAEPTQEDTGNDLILVTKTVTVAEVRPQADAATSVQPPAAISQKKDTAAKHAEFPALESVSYADEKLTVSAVNKFTYKIFELKEPDRFVVDIVGHFKEELPEPKVVADNLVKAVRLGHHEDRIRIVLDLKGNIPSNWSATQTNGTLSVMMK